MKEETRKFLEPLIEKLGVEFLLNKSTHNQNVIKHKGIEKEVEELRNDREFLLPYLKQQKNSNLISLVSPELKKDKNFCLESIKYSPFTLACVDVELRNDEDFVLEALKINRNCVDHITQDLLEDPQFQIKALKYSKKILELAEYELEREVVLEAVKMDGNLIKYDSTHFEDREILFEAMKTSKSVLSHVSDDLRNDQKFMMEMIQHKSFNCKYLSNDLKKNKKFMMEVLRNNKNEPILQYIHWKILEDVDIIELGIENDPISLGFIPKHLSKKKEIILRCLKNFKRNRDHWKHLKDDKDIEWISKGYYSLIQGIKTKNLVFKFK